MNHFTNQLERLKGAFASELPGFPAHARMAPSHRDRLIKDSKGPEYARKSSVLILLFPDSTGDLSIVFIKRVEYDGVHSGQIAFPGGKYEDYDPDLISTALRETEEEIGIRKEHLTLIGKLSDLFVPPSNFIISPFVAAIPHKPLFVPDLHEVAEVFTVPVRFFMQPEALTEHSIQYKNHTNVSVPGYLYNNHLIWGATAMILSEFIQVMQKSQS